MKYLRISVWIPFFLAVFFAIRGESAALLVNTPYPDGVMEDAGEGDSTHCTFKEALDSIQSGVARADCPNQSRDNLGVNDTIRFSVPEINLSEFITYRYDTTLRPVKSVLIDGENRTVTVRLFPGGGLDFSSRYTSDLTSLIFRRLNFVGSSTTSAIHAMNVEEVQVDRCRFSGIAYEAVRMIDSTRLHIVDSQFSDNNLANIANLVRVTGVTTTIERSSFFRNRSSNTIRQDALIFSYDSNMTILNSTFSGNTLASGCVIEQYQAFGGWNLDISHSTIYNNVAITRSVSGVCVYPSSGSVQGRTRLYGNIIAHNLPISSSSDCNLNNLSYGSNNIVSVSTATTGCRLVDGMNGNRVISDFSLPPLDENNVFGTAYHPLPAGSPAIDSQGRSGVTDIDQRGVPRVMGDSLDIGAVESFIPSTIGFTREAFTLSEGESIELPVDRTGSDGAISVTYAFSGDGTGGRGVLRWDHGEEGSKPIRFSAPLDTSRTGNRVVSVTLSELTPSYFGSFRDFHTAQITIMDIPPSSTGGSGGGSGSGGAPGSGGISGSGGLSGTGGGPENTSGGSGGSGSVPGTGGNAADLSGNRSGPDESVSGCSLRPY